MTDEITPASETADAPAHAPESLFHAIAVDLRAILARSESLQQKIKAELAADLEALAAKLKAEL